MKSDCSIITGFRCTNHEADIKRIFAGRFDLDNPCSWCKKQEIEKNGGVAFYYAQFGRWEFPFVAEERCKNFSLKRNIWGLKKRGHARDSKFPGGIYKAVTSQKENYIDGLEKEKGLKMSFIFLFLRVPSCNFAANKN
jgi:hypothetical protein